MKEEAELLGQARNAIQVTVSETNKRAGVEQLTSLLTDIQTHLHNGQFMVAAEKSGNDYLKPFKSMNKVLEISRVIKHGSCQIIPAFPSAKSEKSKCQSDHIIYILLNDVLVFFTKNDTTNVRIVIYISLLFWKPFFSSKKNIEIFWTKIKIAIARKTNWKNKSYKTITKQSMHKIK